ncbi:hypothetical protein [Methylobacterium mesophilicum]
MRPVCFGFEDAVPYAKTVWLFRSARSTSCFAWLKGKGRGGLAMSGQMIDASIIAASRQCNTDAEKTNLKEGRIPEEGEARSSRLAQKDRDACSTLKRAKARPARADGAQTEVDIAIPVFGDMSHVSIDHKYGFVRRFTDTSAAAHHAAQLANILDPANTASEVGAYPAYRTKKNEAYMAKQAYARRSTFGGSLATT